MDATKVKDEAATSNGAEEPKKSPEDAAADKETDKHLDPTPNSKPREDDPTPVETYVYRDFANSDLSTLGDGANNEKMPPPSLQSQKLPSKLAAMLSDPGKYLEYIGR